MPSLIVTLSIFQRTSVSLKTLFLTQLRDRGQFRSISVWKLDVNPLFGYKSKEPFPADLQEPFFTNGNPNYREEIVLVKRFRSFLPDKNAIAKTTRIEKQEKVVPRRTDPGI